jgi:excinuclease UvrABC helicase subunit UvrB
MLKLNFQFKTIGDQPQAIRKEAYLPETDIYIAKIKTLRRSEIIKKIKNYRNFSQKS